MTPEDLKKANAGDIGLCRSSGGVWGLISVFEWMNIPQESEEYCHTLIFQTPSQIWEMTSPVCHSVPASGYDLSRVDLWRLYWPGTNNPIFPDGPESQAAVNHALEKMIGQPYDYLRDARFAVYGIPARLGLPNISKWLLTKDAGSGNVCSTGAEEGEEAAIKILTGKDIDLLPQFGHGMVMPATWTLSPFMRKIC